MTIDVESGHTRRIFSVSFEKGNPSSQCLLQGQAGIRSVCTTFGGNVVVAGDSNGQITSWDLREDNDKSQFQI